MRTSVFLWITSVAQLLLTLLGTVIALNNGWTSSRRYFVFAAFVVLGVTALVATVRYAQRSSSELTSAVTGGDSFCYLDIMGEQIPLGVATLRKEGSNPLDDVNMKLLVNTPIPGGGLAGQTRQLVIGNIPAASRPGFGDISLLPFKLQGHESVDFNVAFSAKNGFWHELMYLRRVGGWGTGSRWLKAIRVHRVDYGSEPYRQAKSALAFEKVDDNFPMEGIGWNDWLLYH